jgi:hypothetical protein
MIMLRSSPAYDVMRLTGGVLVVRVQPLVGQISRFH